MPYTRLLEVVIAMAEERSGEVQGDLEKELTCSVSRCSLKAVMQKKAGKQL